MQTNSMETNYLLMYCTHIWAGWRETAHTHIYTHTGGLWSCPEPSGVGFPLSLLSVKLRCVSCWRDRGFPSGKYSAETRRHRWRSAHTTERYLDTSHTADTADCPHHHHLSDDSHWKTHKVSVGRIIQMKSSYAWVWFWRQIPLPALLHSTTSMFFFM